MALLLGDTTRSSIHDTMQTEIDSRTGHDQSMRKSIGSSTRGAGLLHFDAECLGLKDNNQSTHPHLPNDNEEVNTHVKRLQAMLDAATVVDPALNRDDEA
jgi:hypothetical protein